MTEIEILHRLKVQVDGAISACQIEMMRANENPHFETGGYDMVIGDFRIDIDPKLKEDQTPENLLAKLDRLNDQLSEACERSFIKEVQKQFNP